MIIVGINGGLGNQMFQYALYLKFKKLGKEAYIDDQILVSKLNNVSSLKIFDVFDLDYQFCNRKTREKMADVGMDIFSRARRKLLGKRHDEDTCFREKDFDNNYYPEVLEMDDKYLAGCWQSEKYFEDIKTTIYDNYKFKTDSKDEKLQSILKQIRTTNSVALHIRRGDYVGNTAYEGICTDKYYSDSITYIKQHVDNAKFFIFSDDIEYARQRYQGDNFIIVEGFMGDKSHYDMYLMSQCKHNIVANSSFSWWGAWLNQNKAKFVVSPKKWNNRSELRYTPCDGWIKI